jgi:hypothetical protein
MSRSLKSRAHQRPKGKRNGSRQTQKSQQNNSRGKDVIGSESLRSGTEHLERWMPLFPARILRSLRYATSVGITSTLGIPSSYVFAANGLFDPDITSTGHQPMGFDQMMLSYNHYAVVRSRIFITFRNDSSSSQPTCLVGARADSTPLTVPERILEFGLDNSTTLEFKGVSGSAKSLESKLDIGKFQGVVNVVDDDELHGNVAANPNELTYWHVQLWDSGGLTCTVRVDVVIEYDSWFLEPRELTESLMTLRAECNARIITRLKDLENEKKTDFVCVVQRKA